MGYALKPGTPKSAASEDHEKGMGFLVSALISLAHPQPSSAEGRTFSALAMSALAPLPYVSEFRSSSLRSPE